MALRRSFIRWLAAGTLPLIAIGLAQPSVAATNYTPFNSPVGGFEGSEILDITPDNKFAVMVGANNVGEQKLRIATVDTTNPGVKVDSLDLAVGSLGLTRAVASSVAVYQESDSTYAIVTIKECTEQCTPPATVNPGGAVFVRVAANGDLTLVSRPVLQLGVQPESIDVAPNGDYAVVANEGFTTSSGSISVIDLRNGPAGANVVSEGNIAGEPEAVAISPDNARAFVTLQEGNSVAVLNINPTTLISPAPVVTNLGNNPATRTPLYPDGIAVTPDGQFIVTADEGITNVHSNTVSMFRVNADNTLTPVAHSGVFAQGDPRPEMVAIGTVAGQLRAFVSLENADAVAAFNITTGTTPALTLDTIVQLNPSSTGHTADAPEGVAIAAGVNGSDLIVTANQGSRNISVIRATNTTPTPTPTLREKVYLPLTLNR